MDVGKAVEAAKATAMKFAVPVIVGAFVVALAEQLPFNLHFQETPVLTVFDAVGLYWLC